MKAYAPILTPIPGTTAMHADYGPAHAERQEDAEAALERINYGRTARVLRVVCSRTHNLADVYATPDGYMVLVLQDDHRDADVRRLQRETGLDVQRVKGTMADPLDAPDDRELEARCKCGGRELDRHSLQEAVASGQATLVV